MREGEGGAVGEIVFGEPVEVQLSDKGLEAPRVVVPQELLESRGVANHEARSPHLELPHLEGAVHVAKRVELFEEGRDFLRAGRRHRRRRGVLGVLLGLPGERQVVDVREQIWREGTMTDKRTWKGERFM